MPTDAATGPSTTRAAVVVLAGGSGSRVGADINKVYLPLGGRRVISWSFAWARQVAAVRHLVLVVRAEDLDVAQLTLRRDVPELLIELVIGGPTRHDSEQAALDRLAPRIVDGVVDVVAIHDGARPLAGSGLFRTVLEVAADVGGAVPVLPAGGVIPATDRPDVAGAARRGERLVRVQTPQAFRAAELLAAYAAAGASGRQGTDTASSLEAFSQLRVRAVPGHRTNLKVTYPHDLVLAERILEAQDRRDHGLGRGLSRNIASASRTSSA